MLILARLLRRGRSSAIGCQCLAAPLYLLGYWHLTRNLAPRRPRLMLALFLLVAYAFIIAAVWIGQRIFIAEAVRSAPDFS